MTTRPDARPDARPRAERPTSSRDDLLDLVRAGAAALALLSPLLPGAAAGSFGVVVFFAVSGYVAADGLVAEREAVRAWPWRRPRGPVVAPVLLLVLAAYAVAAVAGVVLAVLSHLPGLTGSHLLAPALPALALSSLWLVVPLVLLVGRDPGRARVAIVVAGVAALLGTLDPVLSGAGGGLPLVHPSWAWVLLLGAGLRAVEEHRARLPR